MSADNVEMKSMAVEEVTRNKQTDDNDARELQELGYRQQLNVRMSWSHWPL